MPSNWSDVEKTTAGGLPTMPTQAIIIGTVLGIGAISCSGFYLSMMGGNVALVPWMCVMLAVAVIFTYVVGFALLWWRRILHSAHAGEVQAAGLRRCRADRLRRVGPAGGNVAAEFHRPAVERCGVVERRCVRHHPELCGVRIFWRLCWARRSHPSCARASRWPWRCWLCRLCLPCSAWLPW